MREQKIPANMLTSLDMTKLNKQNKTETTTRVQLNYLKKKNYMK